MLSIKVKQLIASLATIGLAVSYFLHSDSQDKPGSLTETTISQISTNKPEPQANEQVSIKNTYEQPASLTEKKANQPTSSQVQIPIGAVSLEVMISNFELEKKKASQAALESPFKTSP